MPGGSPVSDDEPRAAAGAVYWLVLLATGMLQVYALAWAWIVVAVLGLDARIQLFEIDLYNALQIANALDIALLATIIGAATAAFVLTLLRNRLAPFAMLLAAAAHTALWLLVLGNPYYDAAPGHVLIPLEVILSVLMLLLRRRGVLR